MTRAYAYSYSVEATKAVFMTRVQQTQGCWMWTGGGGNPRYGGATWKGRTRPAHRVSWEIHNGPIPPGMHVLHRCDVPRCVNPVHLFLGTHADNMADMKAKGRARSPHSGATHCKRGHPFDADNTVTHARNGRVWRQCRACKNMLNLRFKHKDRQ